MADHTHIWPTDCLTQRALSKHDVPDVVSLLHTLPHLYPGGDAWLRFRLKDALAGAARCTLLDGQDGLAGVAIESPKGPGRVKLSTFFIAEHARGRGEGRRFATSIVQRWAREGVGEGYVTVAHTLFEALSATLVPVGFTPVGWERDRYGLGRHECILTALPDNGG